MKSIALLAVAGLATVASAQGQNVQVSDFLFSLNWDNNTIAVGETATATLSASWIGNSTSYQSSINISLFADNAIVSASDTAQVAWNVPILGFDGRGEADGANILNLDAAQFSLFAPPTIENPSFITTFQVTALSEGTLTYSFTTSVLGTEAAFTVSDTSVPTANPAQFGGTGDPVAPFSIETLTVIPAPSAMALLGLGGLVATRRRR